MKYILDKLLNIPAMSYLAQLFFRVQMIRLVTLSVVCLVFYMTFRTIQGMVRTVGIPGNGANTTALLPCPLPDIGLLGRVEAVLEERNWEDIENDLIEVKKGGEFYPSDCYSNESIAIIVPFRNREPHLRVFLNNIHKFLMRQNIHYRIFIISQEDKLTFNRAMLLNVGFIEALNIFDWSCFILHDVDLLPEDDRNLYTCPDMPRHMSLAKHDFDTFGGVSAISRKHFKLLNGYSNQFWGWGMEDLNMSRRIKLNNLTITTYSPDIARLGTQQCQDHFNFLVPQVHHDQAHKRCRQRKKLG